jgi:hypothetical protein
MKSIATNFIPEVVSDLSLNRAHKQLASLCESLIFLGVLE